MNPGFSLKPLPAVTFGSGCLESLCAIAAALGSKILVITGYSFRTRQKSWTPVERQLLETGI